MELQRAKWQEKLLLIGCEQGQRKTLLLSLILKKPRKFGGQQQHISSNWFK